MFAEKEINTGRQIEFDYLKGLFIPMILLIHSFQMMSGTLVPAYKTTYILATMTGSAIFLFVLGLGSTYSRLTNSQLVRDGLKLLLYELIWNVLALGLPMVIGQGVRGLFGLETMWAVVWQRMPMMIEYINIFFIAGVSYLLLALLRQLKTPTWMYFALALLFIVVNPYLYMNGKTTGNVVADYVLTMFAGGRPAVSLCFLAHIPYVLSGVGLGRVLRRTTNKAGLYGVIAVPAVIIVAAYARHAFSVNDGLDALYAWSGKEYIYPGTIRALANCSCVLLMSGLLYALRNQITAIKPVHAALVHLSRKTTPYYAVHPFWFGLIASLLCFAPCSAAFCLWMTPVVWTLCYITIRLWERFRASKR
ncbi:MAG: hypothetical protein ACOX3H_03530 [Saccharofermentanales bacterium]